MSVQGTRDTLRIRTARGRADLAEARRLFGAYAASLAPFDLGYQDFATELAGLPGAYAAPLGALLLALRPPAGPAPRAALGCVALRPTPQAGVGELKRLYVSDEARGTGAGRRLAAEAVRRARRAGYSELVLDTLPTMTAAIGLYRALGFVPTRPYYDTPIAETLFFRMTLGRRGAGGTGR